MRALGLVLILCASPALAAEPSVLWSTTVGQEPDAAAPDIGPTTELYESCGPRSIALETLAARLGASTTRPSPTMLARRVGAAGIAQPWPRAWTVTGDESTAKARFRAWLGTGARPRRCGIAHRVDALGRVTYAAITVDALAELAPIQRRTRVGAWVSIDARLLVDATAAAVVLLGPDGEPRRVTADLANGTIRSRVNLDQPGPWTVQLVATLPSGPEPVLEVRLHAGVDPPTEVDEPAPLALPDVQVLMRFLNAARRDRGLPPVLRTPSLDAAAAAHAAAMAHAERLAHDSGDGDPVERVQASGARAIVVGENIARAGDATAAHRALWESPSHRGNMLARRFAHVGIGVVRDAGGVWVTELFTD